MFVGTPSLAVPPLLALHEAGFDIPLVVSRADARRGRRGDLEPSPVKAAALQLGIPTTDSVDDALGVGADLGVVVAFGRLIKPHVLDALPMVNTHFSLLPRWRGAAPVERALLAGDDVTGVCLMALDEGLDTGAVYEEARVTIEPDDTLDSLRTRLVQVGTEVLVRRLTEGLGEPVPQEGEPTYAEKITPAELCIDWSRPAAEVGRLVRLGGAWTTFRGKRLKVHSTLVAQAPASDDVEAPLAPGEVRGLTVGTGDGALDLVEVQPEGKGRQPAAAWRNGAQPAPGERLGT